MTDARPWRAAVTERTAAYAVSLGRLPWWVPMIAVAVLMVGGLVAGGVLGAALIAVVAVFGGWLAVLRWDELRAAERLARVVGVAVLLAVAVRTVLTG
jgi:hypothetical protein